MQPNYGVRQKIEIALSNFNKYHSPESRASLVKISKDNCVVQFTGSFCETCGVFDYFDDFAQELENAEIAGKEQLNNETYEVTIRFKNQE